MAKCKIWTIVLLLGITMQTNAQLRIDRYMTTGRMQLSQSQFAEALSTFNHIIRIDEDNWEAWYYRGLTKFYQGDRVGSERDFDRAISLQPNLAELYLYRGIVRDYRGNNYGALEDFNRGVELKPDNAGLLYSRGTTYLRLNNFSRSIEDFDRAIKLDPRLDEAYLNRGIARAKMMDREGAFSDFNEAIMLNPFSGQGHQRKGLLQYETGDYQEALISFSEAIQRDSSNVQSFYARALTWYEEDRKDSCFADLTRVIEMDPMHAVAYYNRALTRAQLGDYDGAINDYQKVNDFFPNHVLTYFNRGLLWHQKGELNGALADLSEAIRLYPDFAKAYLARSSVYRAMGRIEQANTDQLTANEKIQANAGKSQDELALNYADTTIHFQELISLNSEFMKTFSSMAGSIDERQLDPVGFFELDAEGKLVIDGLNRDRKYQQLNLGIMYPDFNSEFLVHFDDLDRVISLAEQKKYNEGIEILSENINKDEMPGPSLLMRAKTRLEMIEFVMQTGVLNEVVPLQLGNVQAYGSAEMSDRVDYSEVEEDYSELINLCPDMAEAWYNRGLIRLYSGEFRKAEEDMTKALELNDQLAEAWYNRGIIRIYASERREKMLGNKNDGCMDLSRAGELGLAQAYGVIELICKPEL